MRFVLFPLHTHTRCNLRVYGRNVTNLSSMAMRFTREVPGMMAPGAITGTGAGAATGTGAGAATAGVGAAVGVVSIVVSAYVISSGIVTLGGTTKDVPGITFVCRGVCVSVSVGVGACVRDLCRAVLFRVACMVERNFAFRRRCVLPRACAGQ